MYNLLTLVLYSHKIIVKELTGKNKERDEQEEQGKVTCALQQFFIAIRKKECYTIFLLNTLTHLCDEVPALCGRAAVYYEDSKSKRYIINYIEKYE